MRPVAKFQFTAHDSERSGLPQALDIVEKWSKEKLIFRDDMSVTIRRSGVNASFEKIESCLLDKKQVSFKLTEPVLGGNLHTSVRILESDGSTIFQCVISMGADGGINPPRIPIRSPKFIKNIIDIPLDWRVKEEGERIFSAPFKVSTNGVGDLEPVLKFPRRRLPVILISELEGSPLASDLHEKSA